MSLTSSRVRCSCWILFALGCGSSTVDPGNCPPGSVATVSKEESSFGSHEPFRIKACVRESEHRHGPYAEYWESGEQKSVGSYVNGERHGSWHEWDSSGNKTREATYRFGELHGPKLEYEASTRVRKTDYRFGSCFGTSKLWNSAGVLVLDEECHGLRHGKHRSFYDTGVLRSEGEYLLGEKWGPWKTYFPDGKPETSASYECLFGGSWIRSVRTGRYEEFYESGGIKYRATYDREVLDGVEELWHENGEIRKSARWDDGQLDGETKRWDESGVLRSRTTWEAGSWVVETTWHDNGVIEEHMPTKPVSHGGRAVPHGRYERRNRQGVLIEGGEYRDGKRVGQWIEGPMPHAPPSENAKRTCVRYVDGHQTGYYELGTPRIVSELDWQDVLGRARVAMKAREYFAFLHGDADEVRELEDYCVYFDCQSADTQTEIRLGPMKSRAEKFRRGWRLDAVRVPFGRVYWVGDGLIQVTTEFKLIRSCAQMGTPDDEDEGVHRCTRAHSVLREQCYAHESHWYEKGNAWLRDFAAQSRDIDCWDTESLGN